jgi:hypothetical protein
MKIPARIASTPITIHIPLKLKDRIVMAPQRISQIANRVKPKTFVIPFSFSKS